MKLVVPMAGRGSRFADYGYDVPKPLIEVTPNETIFQWALKSVEQIAYTQIIFIILKSHDDAFGLKTRLLELPNSHVIVLDEVTEGQLATVLTAAPLLDTPEAVLIASSDTYVVSNLAGDIRHYLPLSAGVISVANLPGEHWSFVRADDAGWAVEVAEKVRISDNASTGLYYFSEGNQLVQVASEMIRLGEKTRGEYYVIPVYQKFIERGWRVGLSYATEVWDMGNPDALNRFQAHLKTGASDL